MRKIKLFVASLVAVGALFGLTPAIASAQGCANPATAQEAIQCGTDEAAGQSGNSQNAVSSLDRTVRRIINIFSIVVGLVAVIMIIYAGFRYVTSAGDSNRITGAKNTLLYAVIGLVIVALSQIIVRFVLFQTTTSSPTRNNQQPATQPPSNPTTPNPTRPPLQPD